MPPHAKPAVAVAVSTLTGEALAGASSSGNAPFCPSPNYSVSGAATGPYPGTFTESGTWTPVFFTFKFNAGFTVTSGTTSITGTKALSTVTPGSRSSCGAAGAVATLSQVPYTATIHTADGNFHDAGVSTVQVITTEEGGARLTESFISCKNGGWQNFPQFKNQGQCVSFVEHRS